MASATQLTTHVIATVGGGHDRADPYVTSPPRGCWPKHLLAAALAPDHCLRDVRRWSATRAETPQGYSTPQGWERWRPRCGPP
jgi:hypothetical protein